MHHQKAITMSFKASFCHPLKKDVIDMGNVPNDKVIDTFKNTDWKECLVQAENFAGDPYYSPSLEIENTDNKNSLEISAVGEPDDFCFYVFYKRPKEVSGLFGLSKKMDENYVTDITDQNEQDVLACLNALLKNDLLFLENKIKLRLC
jgi:hypothetical protein